MFSFFNYDQAKDLYGHPSWWNASLVSHLGIVVAGLPSFDIATIVPVEAVTREAFAHMNYEHNFKLHSEYKLSKFAPEVLTRVRDLVI